jgi:hypothetical protein
VRIAALPTLFSFGALLIASAASANPAPAPAPAPEPATLPGTTPGTVRMAPISAGKVTADEPLWQAEIQAGFGLAMGGAGSAMSRRSTPLTLEALVAFEIEDEPPLYVYGGLVVETLDRNGAGAAGGITFRPHDSIVRLSGGGVAMIAPYTAVGASASAGLCQHQHSEIELCGDLKLTSFFAGGDVSGHAITEAQLVLAAVFDAL